MNMPRYIASDATRTQYDEWAQSGDGENEMKRLDRRKTDLHRFLDPFTLLAVEGKTIYIRSIRRRSESFSRAIREYKTLSKRRQCPTGTQIEKKSRDRLRKMQGKGVGENERGIR